MYIILKLKKEIGRVSKLMDRHHNTIQKQFVTIGLKNAGNAKIWNCETALGVETTCNKDGT